MTKPIEKCEIYKAISNYRFKKSQTTSWQENMNLYSIIPLLSFQKLMGLEKKLKTYEQR